MNDMKIEKDRAVRLDYVLRDDDNEIIGAAEEFEYIHGHGNLIPKLEEGLEGAVEGEQRMVVIDPEDAYGLHDPEAVIVVPRDRFSSDVELVEGNMVETTGPHGRIEMMILEINGDDIKVDLNHPLAGFRLHFDVTVGPVREAHPDEIKHGRVHPGGHHLMVEDSSYIDGEATLVEGDEPPTQAS